MNAIPVNKIIRAAAYPRYSSDNQREESITAQMRAIEAYCKQRRYVLVATYPDEAKTATSDNRPNFQKMMEDSANDIFDVVVVHKLDRFARSRYDSAFYKHLLKKNGIRVESALEQLDDTPESILFESVLEGMAEYYSRNLAREVMKGMNENALRAQHVGGIAPYGLKINPKTKLYEIDESRYRAVQIYFESVAAGKPLSEVAETLNAAGYRTVAGKKFTKHSFGNWASNRKYRGDYTWKVSVGRSRGGRSSAARPKDEQVIQEGVIPAIVAPELWDRVNALKEPRKRTGGKMKAVINYLLSGKVVCGKCGSLYAGVSYVNYEKRYAYYRCQGKCGNKQVNKDHLEKIVIDHIAEQCFSDDAMEDILTNVQAIFRDRKASSRDDREPILKEIDSLNRNIDNWTNIAGNIDNPSGQQIWIQKVNDAAERMEALKAELRKIEVLERSEAVDDKLVISILQNKKHLLLHGDDTARKEVLQECLDSVTILNDDKHLRADITVRFFKNAGELTYAINLKITVDKK